MSVLQIALVFFIMTNPLGNSPTIISLIKNYPIRQQQKILFRESIIAMFLAFFFLFAGEFFLQSLKISPYALTTSGGVLLTIVALRMIFFDREEKKESNTQAPPFIVPIATPLISGAGLLTMIMLYSKQEANDLKIFLAILIAWIGVTSILVGAPYIHVLLGKRGFAAMEQLMGMLLAMVAIQMILNGLSLFIKAVAAT